MVGLAVGAGVLAIAGGCGDEPYDERPIAFEVEIVPAEAPSGRYVLHVGEADAEAIGLAEPDVVARGRTFSLVTDQAIGLHPTFRHCFDDDAPVSRDGETVGVVPAGTCLTNQGGATVDLSAPG